MDITWPHVLPNGISTALGFLQNTRSLEEETDVKETNHS